MSPDAPVPVLDESGASARAGGAGLAAVLAARDGLRVTLVTALARDAAGDELRALLERERVKLVDLGLEGATPEKIRYRSAGRSIMRLDRGGSYGRVGAATAKARAAIGWGSAVLVSDYGRGVAAEPGLRAALSARAAEAPLVWDPHPRGPRPVEDVLCATPNAAEAAAFAGRGGCAGLDAAIRNGGRLRAAWSARSVCVTRGAEGAVLVRGEGPPLVTGAEPARGGDACGAGDRFASRLAGALAGGESLPEAVGNAVVTAAAFVAGGGAGGALADRRPAATDREDGLQVLARVRAAGGTIVATGGCFDLLHAGHVRTLEAARRLGDALVVCLNSDESVRRLKGRGRPLVPASDRAAVLAALTCVDAVTVFAEDTPAEVLRELRPHIWAKGGDYAGRAVPEERVLSDWGGRAVVLPYLEGRSTTRLMKEAACRA